MELWQDSHSEPIHEFCSRVWSGSASDVAEVNLDDANSQQEAISLIGMVPWILVRCSDWTMIPLENLVSISRGTGTKISVAIDKIIDLNGAAFALEHGVDAILLQSSNSEIWKVAIEIASKKELIISNTSTSIDMDIGKIFSIDSSGIGERVCVDLIERLDTGEGLVIGSNSSLLALVHGETIESQFVPSRPFRVNAGSVHSYVLMSDNSTRYLSELKAGDEVAVISSFGEIRKCIIGRLKIERRPFIIIRFKTENEEVGQVILQQAETVRLIDKFGNALSVTDLKIGDEIIIRKQNQMRHIGKALEGEMNEK
jgi:3-dehydroquinate synthase II